MQGKSVRGAVVALTLWALVAGCSRLQSYSASLSSPAGQYDIVNKRGALLTLKHPDGTEIVADDRGHARPKGAIESVLTLLLLKKTE